MAGRGPQSFKKRQKEQQRKEKQQDKAVKRVERKSLGPAVEEEIQLGDNSRLAEFLDFEDDEETAEQVAARVVGLAPKDAAV
jgi:hypothetical protein